MAEKTRNLCAEIPEELHSKVRQRQNESGKTLSQYMTWLITTFYEMEDKSKMSKENTRTVAFQVPEELFERFKEFLCGEVVYRPEYAAFKNEEPSAPEMKMKL